MQAVIFSIITLIIILFLVHIRCKLQFFYSEDEKGAEITVRYLFFKFRVYPVDENRKQKPSKKEKQEKTEDDKPEKKFEILKDFEFFSEIIPVLTDAVKSILSYLIKRFISIETLNISAAIGFDTAMNTGMAVGAANAFVYGIIASMQRNMRLKDYSADISGDFEDRKLKFGVNLELYTSIMRILALAGILIKFTIKIIRVWRRNKNGKSGNRNG